MTKVRFALVVVIIALLAVIAFAQDENSIPDDLQAVMVHTALSGAFGEDADGFMTVSLTGVSANVSVFSFGPTRGGTFYGTQDLVDDWNKSQEISFAVNQTTAYLSTGDVTVELIIFSPSYDPDTQTLTYSVGEVVATTTRNPENTKPAAPETFEEASLFIYADSGFAVGLELGRIERLNTSRPVVVQPCNPLLQVCK